MKLLHCKLGPAFLCVLLSAGLTAQVKTETSKTQGQSQVATTVERGEVFAVSGNDLVVKMDDGTLRNFQNVPESARVTVDGKQLSIHDLKPGMKLQRTITTTTTPETVTTVKSVTGKVWQVNPPLSVTLRLEDGSVQRFKIPKGQKFTVNGQETDAFGLRKGMDVSATQVNTASENAVSQQRSVTGEMPPPPPAAAVQAPVAQGPILIVVEKQPAQVAQAQPPQKLPQTASYLPLLGLVGTLLFLSGAALFVVGSRKLAR